MQTTFIVPIAPRAMMKKSEFRSYLEKATNDPFSLNLKAKTLREIIDLAIEAKSRRSPNYGKGLSCLNYQINALERDFGVTLRPLQITDIFWDNFVHLCFENGLKSSTIETIANQLRSILNWAVKYGAEVSPTYGDFKIPRYEPFEIALTADEVSRIHYFDIDRFYAKRRSDYRATMHRVRDMFVLSVCLFQRHSDMVRISKACFDRNIFSIVQQKTGNRAVVNIDKYSAHPKAAYEILERYDYTAPFAGDIGNYNHHLHELMRDIGFVEPIRREERVHGELVTKEVPKWQMISSHTARRTAITIAVLRGHNMHALKKASGHTDLRVFDRYIREE